MKKDRKKNNAGMTIIEVVLAFALMVITASPLLAAFAQSLKMEARTAMHNLTTFEAQMKMEEAYGMSLTELNTIYDKNGVRQSHPINTVDGQIELYDEYDVEDFDASLKLYRVKIKIGHEYYAVDTELEAIIHAE